MAILTINSRRNCQPNSPDATGRSNQDGTTILLGKFKVETEYFEIIENRFSDIAPLLLAEIDYTAQDLVGQDMWTELTGFGQRQAVLCLQHMATAPGAGLTDMSSTGCGTTSFQIG